VIPVKLPREPRCSPARPGGSVLDYPPLLSYTAEETVSLGCWMYPAGAACSTSRCRVGAGLLFSPRFSFPLEFPGRESVVAFPRLKWNSVVTNPAFKRCFSVPQRDPLVFRKENRPIEYSVACAPARPALARRCDVRISRLNHKCGRPSSHLGGELPIIPDQSASFLFSPVNSRQ